MPIWEFGKLPYYCIINGDPVKIKLHFPLSSIFKKFKKLQVLQKTEQGSRYCIETHYVHVTCYSTTMNFFNLFLGKQNCLPPVDLFYIVQKAIFLSLFIKLSENIFGNPLTVNYYWIFKHF